MLNKIAIALSLGVIALSGAAYAQSTTGAAGDRPTAVECQRPVHMAGCDNQSNQTNPDFR